MFTTNCQVQKLKRKDRYHSEDEMTSDHRFRFTGPIWPRYRGVARHSVKCWLNTRHKRNSRKNFSLTVDESNSDGFTLVGNELDLVGEISA